MSIETEFQSTIQNVENAYTGLVNLGGDLTGINKNIQNIKTVLDNIYDNTPKTEYAEGTDVTITGGRKGKLDTTLEGNTTQDGEPTPSNPIPISVVTGENEVIKEGKNLVEGLEYGEINAQTGVETDNSTVVRTINYIPYSRLKSYRQSVNGENLSAGTNLRFYNKDKEYIGYAFFGNSTSITDITITKGTGVTTTDLEPKYFKIRVQTSVLDTTSKYMIATDNDLTYEPYHTPISYPLSLGNIELAKISTYSDLIFKNIPSNPYYSSSLIEGAWYKLGNIKKVTLTGSDDENWSVSQSGTSNWYYSLPYTTGGNTGAGTITQLKCNYFRYASITSSTTDEGIWYSANYIRIRYGTQDTPTNFKNWLSTHNVLLYYAGIDAQITCTQITDTTLISQLENIYNILGYDGTTILTSTCENGNARLILKSRALKGE